MSDFVLRLFDLLKNEPILFALAGGFCAWGWLNWKELNTAASHPGSFINAIKSFETNSLGESYRRLLAYLLDKSSGFFKDQATFVQAGSVPISPPAQQTLFTRLFGLNPFTAASYGRCLQLAFIYPVLFFIIGWACGGDGQLNGIALLPDLAVLIPEKRWLILVCLLFALVPLYWVIHNLRGWRLFFSIEAFLLVAGLLLQGLESKEGTVLMLHLVFVWVFVSIYLGGWLVALVITRSPREAHQQVRPIAIAVAFAFAFGSIFAVSVESSIAFAVVSAVVSAFAGASAVSAVGAVVGSFTSAFAGASAVSGAVAGAGVFVGAGASIIGLMALRTWSMYKAKESWFWVFYTVQLLLLAVWLLKSNAFGSGDLNFKLFLFLLPLVNAPLDWLSLGVTRGLLQSVRTGHHGGKLAVAWGLLDLLVALVFLFIISAVMVLMISFMGVVAGESLMDLPALFAALRNNPKDASHWWVYFMLLSTLVPTLFHFVLAGGAITFWLPQRLRQQLVSSLEQDRYEIFKVWGFITFTPVIGFILAPLALCYLLYYLLAAHGAVLGNLLLNWIEVLAALFGG